jgi:gamma-glutamyl-gamma-aminobutyrate hydrolase PuuD
MPVAWAEDGVVEAVELPDLPSVIGVQWHPEEGTDLRLFSGFLDMVRASAAGLGATMQGASVHG